jgi:hypothetical protein
MGKLLRFAHAALMFCVGVQSDKVLTTTGINFHRGQTGSAQRTGVVDKIGVVQSSDSTLTYLPEVTDGVQPRNTETRSPVWAP